MFDTTQIGALIHSSFSSPIPDGASFRCSQIGGRDCFVGRDESNDLIALFPVCAALNQFRVNQVEFSSKENVVWIDTDKRSAQMALLRVRRNSTDDAAMFASVVSSIMNATKQDSCGEEYKEVIDAWMSLLNSGQQPSFAEVLGLWGELFLIGSASEPSRSIEAWQWQDREPSDFLFRGQALEIKTTISSVRKHSTSLQQHRYLSEFPAALISIKTSEEFDGSSVEDLVSRVLERMTAESIGSAKLISAVARRIGFGPEFREFRFSEREAGEHLKAYDWAQLPAPIFPREVIEGRWTFVLNDEDGTGLGGTSLGASGIAGIFV